MLLSYITASIIPFIIIVTIVAGIISKKDVLSLFIQGVNEGLKLTLRIFPNILAITVAISLMRETGALEMLSKPFMPLLEKMAVPEGIISVAMLRTVSGGGAYAVLIDTIQSFGVNSKESKMACVIMAGSETTIYVISMLFAAGRIKKGRGVLVAGITADIVAVALAIFLINMGFW